MSNTATTTDCTCPDLWTAADVAACAFHGAPVDHTPAFEVAADVDGQTMRPIPLVVEYLCGGGTPATELVATRADREAVRAVATIRHLPDGGQEIRVPLDFYDRF